MSTTRSEEIFACAVCGARTNLVHVAYTPSMRGMTGRMVWGDHQEQTICPNAETCWHHELEAKLQWLRFPHPETTRKALVREINKIRKQPCIFMKNDVNGIAPDTAPTRRVQVTFARRSDASLVRCTHHRDRDGQIIELDGVPVEPPFR